MEVFGLDILSNRIAEKLKVKVNNKNNPEKWTWIPDKPEKIRDIQNEVTKEKEMVEYAAISNYTPNDKKQKIVLVFAMGNLSYSLIKNLEQEGLKYFYLDFVQFIAKGKVNYKMQNGDSKAILKIDGLTLDLKDVAVVLWNPPKFPYPLFEFDVIKQNGEERRTQYLFRKRWAQVLREISDVVSKDCIWLPGDIYTGWQGWQQKINEYFVFEQEGMQVPPTIFTNDIEELNAFAQEHGNKLLLREFCCPPYSFPPVTIDVANKDLEKLPKSPCTFQKYINKKFEYRVVLLNDKIWACQIHSQDSELTKNDWRVHDDANVKWEIVELPKNVVASLHRIKNRLNLRWGSADLILGTDDKYYILELNRPGAHYWLDLFVGLDIGEELVNEIKGHVEVAVQSVTV